MLPSDAVLVECTGAGSSVLSHNAPLSVVIICAKWFAFRLQQPVFRKTVIKLPGDDDVVGHGNGDGIVPGFGGRCNVNRLDC